MPLTAAEQAELASRKAVFQEQDSMSASGMMPNMENLTRIHELEAKAKVGGRKTRRGGTLRDVLFGKKKDMTDIGANAAATNKAVATLPAGHYLKHAPPKKGGRSKKGKTHRRRR